MRTIVVLLSMFIAFNCNAQFSMPRDTCFTKEKIIEIAKEIVRLQEADTLNKVRIQSLQFQLSEMTKAHMQSESMYNLSKQENDIYKQAINNFTGIEFDNKANEKVNDNKVLWFAIGVGTGILVLYTGAKIVKGI